MVVHVSVPVSTEVIAANPDCAFSGAYEDGALVITIDTRNQNLHQRLGLGTKTKLHWGAEHELMVQELSALAWPLRYRLLTRDGYYLSGEGERVHFTTAARGLDARRGVSLVLMRAAVLLSIVAGVGCRRAAWLLKELFHVEVSKSAVHRWVEEIATSLPASDEIIKALDAKQPITEAHFDEMFPRGSNACVLVLKDEHGRILATQEVDKRDAASVAPFLQRMKEIGLNLKTFYIDGCKAYYSAIRAVFGEAVVIQYDYFHILQNVWRQLWKWAVARRRQINASSEASTTPWYKQKLEALAKSLWEHRYLLFTAEERMSEEEKLILAELVEAERHVGKLRAFRGGVWNIFEESADEQEAREALAVLKQMPVDREHPEPFRKVIAYLEEHFEWMTAFLRHDGVKRNSLAESGMRVLRRLEVEHDGFRSAKGRDNCLRIYQAVKYLGWSVHQLPQSMANTS
ncbi:MAG: transposase [Pyrinomonadaceae bacterium]|nr:transposase [Pyrinomonadaceae bacterium]